MRIEAVITLANQATKLEFYAMERSLRATGCSLPILVIPYDEKQFDLPEGSVWWEIPEVLELVEHSHPMFRKYQCLVSSNYQFVDTDCIFLKDPVKVLIDHDGFVTCCGHWRDPSHATTEVTRSRLGRKSTLWQRNLFNAGQFACDRPLYTAEELRSRSAELKDLNTDRFHDQPAMNLLVAESGVSMINLTLPPCLYESSWAGDYPEEFESYWSDTSRMPYMIHWAGCSITGARPIDTLFLQYLTADERIEYCTKKPKGWRSLFSPSLA